MPDFTRAVIATTTADLSAYTDFLRQLQAGQVVTLPLEAGETPRQVMRHLNAAAGQLPLRVQRLPSDDQAVRFKVLPAEKREVRISEETKRARVEKARASRAARKGTLLPASTPEVEEPAASSTARAPSSSAPPQRTRRPRRSKTAPV